MGTKQAWQPLGHPFGCPCWPGDSRPEVSCQLITLGLLVLTIPSDPHLCQKTLLQPKHPQWPLPPIRMTMTARLIRGWLLLFEHLLCAKHWIRCLPLLFDLILSTTLRSGSIIPILQTMKLSLRQEKQSGIQMREAEGRDQGSGPLGWETLSVPRNQFASKHIELLALQ